MNDKFEVGDLVIAPRLWEGERRVTSIDLGESYPVKISERNWRFTLDGKEVVSDLQPSLYHAGTEIIIKEKNPVRWPWVNVYQMANGKITTGELRDTKKDAVAKSDHWNGAKYLFTCQLKPEETK